MLITRTSPSVEVVWWTDTNFYIRCPYCEEIHRHGFVSYDSARRVPDCRYSRPSYQVRFPDAYEIDKRKGRFVNVDLLQYLEDESEDEDNETLLSEFSNMSLSDTFNGPKSYDISFDDSTEKIIIPFDGEEPFEERRILFAISDCVCGKTFEVKNYLENSSDKLIFLHGHEPNGDTCLIMAAQGESSQMVSLLLDYGAIVNATNRDGRSALMEAALWGRLETVELLLARGADPFLRDKKNRRALDLAQATRQNRKERHTRTGGIWGDRSKEPFYKEDVNNRDADRREISRMLDSKLQIKIDRKSQVPDSAYHTFRRSTDGRSIIHYGSIQEYPITRRNKTIAILKRGGSFPIVAAMSGWSHGEYPSTRVSGKDWTRKVFDLAGLVGHRLSPHECDQGIEGRFHASHAEKQLIAYFLDRHIFLPEDKSPHPCFDEELERLNSDIEEMYYKYPVIEDFFRFRIDKEDLEHELSFNDDPFLGEEYDEELVRDLKRRIASRNEQGTSLENKFEVKALKAQEQQIKKLEQENEVHCRLNRLSEMAPNYRLSQVTILISAPKHNICDDCLLFRDKVNQFFDLSIELIECTDIFRQSRTR